VTSGKCDGPRQNQTPGNFPSSSRANQIVPQWRTMPREDGMWQARVLRCDSIIISEVSHRL